jgi:hypothetical protein
MDKREVTCCYFPTTVLFLDDNNNYYYAVVEDSTIYDINPNQIASYQKYLETFQFLPQKIG